MSDHWRVVVERNGEEVVSLESHGHLAGREPSDEDEHAIEAAARYLLSFIGAPQPPNRDDWPRDSSWDVMDLDLREPKP